MAALKTLLLICAGTLADRPVVRIPDNFLFGTVSAAYEIEGAWNEDGKGESIWDRALHQKPELVVDQTNGDTTCDSYHKYQEDVELLKNLGVDFYRFSISWPRILPTGKTDQVNPAGLAYYSKLIDELLANGIEPYVTMYHWDLPQALQDEGGWLEPKLANYFVDYARILFENFGDRVKHWMTFNEITAICEGGYGEAVWAPFLKNPGVGDYQCAHIVLLAHGKTYRMFENEFKSDQNGQIGIAIDSNWHEPENPKSESDLEASEVTLQMNFGWFVNPIVHGDYPPMMIDRIRNVSLNEGFNASRLPEFSPEEQEMMKGTFDFLGLNHYTSDVVSFADQGAGEHPSHWADVGVRSYQNASWPSTAASWVRVVPWGIKKLLVWIKDHYGNPPVLITENGFPDTGELEDYDRANYIRDYLYEVVRAIYEDECDVLGYTVWSLMDDFEWTSGFTLKFGLHHVDFGGAGRNRTGKVSAGVYKNIITNRYIDWSSKPK